MCSGLWDHQLGANIASIYLHAHCFCVGNLTCFAAISRTNSASSNNAFIPCTFHEIFRRCCFVYTKEKEDFFMGMYIPSIVVSSQPGHGPHSADPSRA